jgi:hypothetical protein
MKNMRIIWLHFAIVQVSTRRVRLFASNMKRVHALAVGIGGVVTGDADGGGSAHRRIPLKWP